MKCCIHVLSNVLAMSLHNYNFFCIASGVFLSVHYVIMQSFILTTEKNSCVYWRLRQELGDTCSAFGSFHVNTSPNTAQCSRA